jgi:hypothetical protein
LVSGCFLLQAKLSEQHQSASDAAARMQQQHMLQQLPQQQLQEIVCKLHCAPWVHDDEQGAKIVCMFRCAPRPLTPANGMSKPGE